MACSYISSELPDSQTFDETVSAAQEEWNAGILSKIVVNEKEGERNETLWRMLYSGLYMTALMPTDRTGENPHWEGGVYYDDWVGHCNNAITDDSTPFGTSLDRSFSYIT
jgi:putative alpha-1,2-mannosidase